MKASTVKEESNREKHTGGHKTRVRDIFDGLTLLEYRFCHEYLVDGNGKLAYTRAGGSGNYQTAQRQSYLYLQRPEIRKKIREIVKSNLEDTEIRRNSVLHALAALALTNITDVVTWDESGHVQVIPSGRLTPEQAFAIQWIRETTRTITSKSGDIQEIRTMEVKLFDKKKPLDLLGKHLRLFENSEGGAGSDLGKRLEAAKARNEKRKLRLVSGDNRGLIEDATVVENGPDDTPGYSDGPGG